MKAEIPDFTGWHELKDKKQRHVFLDGRIFIELRCYITVEVTTIPEFTEKIFFGTTSSFYGKKILIKSWTIPSFDGKESQSWLALLLENGEWVVSLPISNTQGFSDFMSVVGDRKDLSVQINILTESGWKYRTVKAK